MSTVFKLAFDIGISVFTPGMAIGPIMGYLYQYRLIHKTKSVGSFSIDICGILLLANILRLNFYLFKKFETALVFQSLFMIAMQVENSKHSFSFCRSALDTRRRKSKPIWRQQSKRALRVSSPPRIKKLRKKSSFGDGKHSINIVNTGLSCSNGYWNFHSLFFFDFCFFVLCHPHFGLWRTRWTPRTHHRSNLVS